ncbi:conserved Plasmodium protein, unknown function [Plasmodium relictum]|uniref:Uncharacterized protein n=1 Tax=Plasmodium relictum TaxID=85471 RepID=A0A1J1H5Q5_PLARL|nr:conserved Plasmodium protein, unknown function [Plasmodium relictum]CRH00239.1 conserved Plasmodium protein, unknown function [Plasmodium relictum]
MDYNGDILDIGRNDLLVNQITKHGRKIDYNLFLFKMRSKSDKLRHYEINNSITSENFIKAYLTKESNFILLSNNRFYMYDNENKKKRCLMNLNDSEPIDFIYFKEHIIFIQKNNFSLFQSKTNGKCKVMLNLKDTPLKVNFCSYKNMLYLSTCRRLYFLKLIYLKDKTLKVENTNMSLPFKSKKEKYVYHSYKNKFYKINKEYKEVIHVCGYSDKDITVYKFVKGKYKNKKKCLMKFSVNELKNEIIKGGFFFKINVSDKKNKVSENFGNLNNDKTENISDKYHLINGKNFKNENVCMLLSSNNLFLDDKRKEKERENNSNDSSNSLNVCEHKENEQNNIPLDLNIYNKENENNNMKEQGNMYNLEIKEDIIKLYLLIYTENGKILIYFVDYLNQSQFKFGFSNIKKNPIIYMQLPFKTSFIYNVSDIFSERVIKQKSIIHKKKRKSQNYNKYIEHMINKEIYINSNFFFDAIVMNDKIAKIYTIQIHHDFLYISQNVTEPVALNVIDSNNKIIAIKNVSDNEQKKNLIEKVVNESKFSCYSDSDSYIDSEITWEDSDHSNEKYFYSESDSLMENDSTNDKHKNKLNSINNFTNNINMEKEQIPLDVHLNGSIKNEQNDNNNEKMKEIESSLEDKQSVNSSLNKSNVEIFSEEYSFIDNKIHCFKEEKIDEDYALELKNSVLSIDEKKKKKINNSENIGNCTTANNNEKDIYTEDVSFLNEKINRCTKNKDEKLLNDKTDDSKIYYNEKKLEDSSELDINKNILKNQIMLYSTNFKNSNDNLSISSSSLLNDKNLNPNKYINEKKEAKCDDGLLYDKKGKNKKENINDKNSKDENKKEEKLLGLKKVEEIISYSESQEMIVSKEGESNMEIKEIVINNENRINYKEDITKTCEEIEQKENENGIIMELKEIKKKIIEKKGESEKRINGIDKGYENEEIKNKNKTEIELDNKKVRENKGKKNTKIEEKKNVENIEVNETEGKGYDNIEDEDENDKKKLYTDIIKTEIKAGKESKNTKEEKIKKNKKIKEIDEINILDEKRGKNVNTEEEKEMNKKNKNIGEEKGITENEKINEQNENINEEKEINENIELNGENTDKEEEINKNEDMNKENKSAYKEKEKSKKKKKRKKDKVEKVVEEDIKENIEEKSKKRKTEDEYSNDKKDLDNNFNGLENNSNDVNNKLDKDLVNSNDKFLIISSMIKLNISLKRYSNVIDLINTKDTKLIKNTINNLGKKHSIKLLEFLLNCLTKSKFFINTFYMWIKTICKVHKNLLKGRKYRRLVTKISGIALNNLKNENMVKHVVEKINYTIDNIIKNQVFDNVEILNYRDGTIIK